MATTTTTTTTRPAGAVGDPIDLDELLEASREARRRVERAQADAAAKRAADDLRSERARAVKAARDALELETQPADWHRLEDPEAAGGVVLDLESDDHDHDLALAYRTRGVTLGGPVLTVVARSLAERAWVSSTDTIGGLDELAAAVDDAVARADRWDVDAAREEAQTQALEDGEAEGPEDAVVVSGPTLEAVLARVILEIARTGDVDA